MCSSTARQQTEIVYEKLSHDVEAKYALTYVSTSLSSTKYCVPSSDRAPTTESVLGYRSIT